MDVPAAMREAMAHHQAGRSREAEQIYRAILAHDADHLSATFYLGLLASQTDRVDEAVQLFERASQIAPGEIEPRRQLATLCFIAGRYTESAKRWEDVAAREPADALNHYRLGDACDLGGDPTRAATAYRTAAQLQPAFVEAHANLGGVLLRLGRLDEAIAAMREADRLRPNQPAIESSLGAALLDAGHIGEALRFVRAAADRAPNDPQCWHWNVGHALAAIGDVEGAIAALKRGVDVASHWPALFSDLLVVSQNRIEEQPAEQLAMHREFERRYVRPATPLSTRPFRDPATIARPRIGYVSADFRQHPVGHFIEPLLAAHDPQRVEVHCFSNQSSEDDLTRRIRSHVTGWHPIAAMSDDGVEELIRALEIDILVDLSGHTSGNRMRLFTRRCARLQATYLGYGNTTGLSAIDVRITDSVIDPPGIDAFHTERLLRLSRSFGLFRPIDAAPPVVPPPAQSNGFVTFGCVSRAIKISDGVLDAWTAILRQLPTSRLMLVGLGYDDPWLAGQLRDRFATHGLDPSRVDLVGKRSFADYLAIHAQVDMMLDTFPVNGHTTTLHSLWMGVPVLTLAGPSYRSRLGASVLERLDLQEWIATNSDEYVRKAVGLVNDRPRLVTLRNDLRRRLLECSLTDSASFAREFETLLIDAWRCTP